MFFTPNSIFRGSTFDLFLSSIQFHLPTESKITLSNYETENGAEKKT